MTRDIDVAAPSIRVRGGSASVDEIAAVVLALLATPAPVRAEAVPAAPRWTVRGPGLDGVARVVRDGIAEP